MEVFYLLSFFVVVLTIWYLRFLRFKRLVDKIPGLPTLPLIGNVHQLKAEPSAFFYQLKEMADRYRESGAYRVWYMRTPVVFIYKPDFLENVLNSTTHTDKAEFYELLNPWLGTGLLTRKLLTPAFHFRILNDFLGIFNEQCRTLIKKLESKVGEAQFDIFPYLTLCALDIICETAMGCNVDAQRNNTSEYVQDIQRISEMLVTRFKKPWFRSDFIFNTFGDGKELTRCLKVLHGFTKKVIKERKDDFQTNCADLTMENLVSDDGRKRRLAFLDLLLCKSEDESHLSAEDIQEEVDTFMFEGHDTTGAAFTWAVYLIGSHPEVQDKLYNEIKTVLGDSDDGPTMNQLKELKYLECVLKESLRLFPSVPSVGRTLSKDQYFGEFLVPKGTDVFLLFSALHEDEKHFPEPHKFDPDRFLPENCAGRHPFCYVPFSAGPRNCIGQKFALLEDKVVISSILRKFKIQSVQRKDDLHIMGELIMRPRDGLFVKLTARN